MSCSLYDDADTCNGNCETCTDWGAEYDRYDMYKYQQLTDYGTPDITVICCPACKRMKTYNMEDYWEHSEEYLTQGDCKKCKWHKQM